MVFKRLYLCDDIGDNTVTYGTKMSRLNRTALSYSSNVSLPHGLHDDMRVSTTFLLSYVVMWWVKKTNPSRVFNCAALCTPKRLDRLLYNFEFGHILVISTNFNFFGKTKFSG